METVIFLSSGLFLGWSLGSNDAANVFGTAVGSRMIRFRTAAFLCSLFVMLGAVISGEGASQGLSKLGTINALPGAFVVALSAAMTITVMVRMGLPVSTTQAIVGGIIGWNLYTDTPTDITVVSRIVGTWIFCPILAAIFSAVLYVLLRQFRLRLQLHLLREDFYLRIGLILTGIFGSYSLGANNIGNVMGVFVPVTPFHDVRLLGTFSFTAIQQLFLLGSIAIATGIYTYSKPVMMTVGNKLMKLKKNMLRLTLILQKETEELLLKILHLQIFQILNLF